MKKNKGIMMVLLGTDGSGKTTIVEYLPQYLVKNNCILDIKYFHWRPDFIAKGNPTKIGKKVDNPHGKPLHTKLKSFVKYFIINLDYLFGYLFLVKPQLKQGKLVIFDRYYYDYYLDRLRYRLNISDRVLNIFLFMIPKPDMTFLLIGTPEILYERKKEVPVEEIRNQVNMMYKYEKYMRPCTFINVNNPIDTVVSNIGKFVLEKVSSR